MLPSFVNADNVKELLALAETGTAYELRQYLCGEDVDPEGATVVLRFTPGQFAQFEATIVPYGAKRKGGERAGRHSTGSSHFCSEVVRPTGFEPVAPRLGIWCSILLSYGRPRPS